MTSGPMREIGVGERWRWGGPEKEEDPSSDHGMSVLLTEKGRGEGKALGRMTIKGVRGGRGGGKKSVYICVCGRMERTDWFTRGYGWRWGPITGDKGYI